MIRVPAWRYFLVVSPPAIWMQLAFGASVLIGIATLWLNPKDVDSAFGSVLLLQMFAASSGFGAAAARGYFDPVLSGGQSRRAAAVGSLCASTLPGLVAWATVALMAALLARSSLALSLHRQVAVVLVSAVAWAGGLALPRMAAGGLWTFVLVTGALSRGALSDYLTIVQTSPAGFGGTLSSAAAFAVCPFLLLGDFPAAKNAGVLFADLGVAVAAVWLGVRYVSRRDYSLVEPA